MFEVKKGDLFQNGMGEKTVLVHACNCKGVWGSGIAVEFKKRFPAAFQDYQKICNEFDHYILGLSTLYIRPNEQVVGCLYTSYDYGDRKDSQKKILDQTAGAIESLLWELPSGFSIHSPKINSGRFGIPWEETEKVIKDCLQEYNVNWTVWDND